MAYKIISCQYSTSQHFVYIVEQKPFVYALNELFYLFLRTSPEDIYYPHFTDENTEAQRG